MTNKYTRTFADFNNYPWPGKILPEYFEYRRDAGDSNMGLQAMTQGALSAYGPYHVIEGCEYQSPGVATEWTGSVGFVMYSGLIREVSAASGDLAAAGSYLIYNGDSSFDVTGAKPTGVILAHNIGGVVYTNRTRIDTNSKTYLANDLTIYGAFSVLENLTVSGVINLTGDITHYGNITGTASYEISGYTLDAPPGGLTVGVHTLSDAEWRQLTGIDSTAISANEWAQIGNIGAVTISANEWSQIANIGDATSISAGEWGYVAGMQNVATSANPTFIGLTLSADLITTSTVDGVDLRGHTHAAAGENGGTVNHTELSNKGSNTHTQIDTHITSTVLPHIASASKTNWDAASAHVAQNGLSHIYINQDLRTSFSPTFAGLTVNGTLAMGGNVITTSSTVDGVDVSTLNTNYTNHAASSSNPHTVTLDQAFDGGKIINGASSEVNAFQVGDGTRNIAIWGAPNYTQMKTNGGIFYLDTSNEVYIRTSNDDSNYHIFDNTAFYPSAGGLDLGRNLTTTWDVVYYHTMTDKSCASFVGYQDFELYNMLKAIQPRTDGLLHHDKNNKEYFPHIDMATIPNEFACYADEDYTQEKIPKDVDGKKEKIGKIDFKKGDKAGVNFNTMVYAMNELLVKSYEKIKSLEEEVTLLKNG